MAFTFKLSKRLALIFAAVIGGSFVSCSDDVPSTIPVLAEPPAALGDTIFSDGFESGSLTWDDNFSPQAKAIVAGAARTGARGLRVTFTPTANGGVLSKFVARGDRVYVRAAVRFPSTWTGATGLLTVRAAPATNPWAGFGKAGVCPDGRDWAVTGTKTTVPNLDQYFHTYAVGMRAIAPGQCQGSTGQPTDVGLATYTPPLAISKGGWHVIELEAQLNTVGVADGWQKMWLDGTLQAQWTGLTFRTSSTVQWNAVSLEMPASGVTQTQALDFDDILVGRTRPGNPVATVQVTPATATLDPGQSLSLAATLRDASGNVLANRAIVWTSSNPTVASVSPTGVVVALLAGTATIAATSEGRSASAAVTVRAPAPTGTVLFSEGFDDALVGSRGWYDFANPVVTTADKHSGTGSLQIQWAAGATTTPLGVMRKLFTATDRLYVSYWVKYSTNYMGSGKPYHPHEFSVLSNQEQDWDGLTFNYLNTYIEQNYQNGGIPRIAIQDSRMIDASKIGVNLTGVTENRSVGGCNGNSDGTGVTSCFQMSATQWYNVKEWDATAVAFRPAAGSDYKGSWNRVEVELQLNSISGGIGQQNGVVRYWLNGNLKLERTNVLFRTGANPGLKFRQFLLTPYIGDGSPVAQTMWIDDLVVGTVRDASAPPPPPPAPAPPPPPPAPPAPVATVSVMPSSATVAVGATVQLNAVTRDAAGATLIGRTINWTTSASGIATVVNGLVTGRGAGQATITATSEGRSGSATVTVSAPAPLPPPSPPAPAGSYPHEPAGATAVLDWDTDFSALPTMGSVFSFVSGTGNLSTTTDPTAPVNPNKVGRVRFSAGCCDGTGPAEFHLNPKLPSSWTQLYVSDWLKFDATFKPHGCCQKIFEFYWNAGGDNWLRIMTNWGVPLTPQFVFSAPGIGTVNLGGRPIIRLGVWYQIEVTLHKSGRMQLWIREQGKASEVLYDGTPSGPISPSDVFWWWGYGGTGAYPGPTSYIYHNHMRVSYTR